jgi:hypothetical protein
MCPTQQISYIPVKNSGFIERQRIQNVTYNTYGIFLSKNFHLYAKPIHDMKSVFNPADVAELIARINKLTPQTHPQWGKMSAPQMLAHCNVSYELVYSDKHPKPNAIVKLLLKAFVKDKVVGPKPYKHNTQTAPAFIIKDERDFETEKANLVGYLNQTLELGEVYFDNKESHSFGALSTGQWNTMFYKHLDHHLTQFGV